MAGGGARHAVGGVAGLSDLMAMRSIVQGRGANAGLAPPPARRMVKVTARRLMVMVLVVGRP